VTVEDLHLGDLLCLQAAPYCPMKVETLSETQVILNPYPFKALGGRKTMTVEADLGLLP
jgi:hypothetical protein